jgi:methanogenic corrinoid protein MtbC1
MNLNVASHLLPRLNTTVKIFSDLVLAVSGKEPAIQSVFAAANDAKASAAHCKTSLLSVIESQIIPRLLDAHQGPALIGLASIEAPSVAATPQDMQDFATACIDVDSQAVFTQVDVLRGKGLSAQTIFLDVITPAARHLGDLWNEDKLDFTVVAQGLLRMHHAMRHLGYETKDGPQIAGDVRRIMLASAPGSQHILGLAMVAEFFRGDGWQVVVEISTTENALLNAVSNEWFDVVGLSVGLLEQLPNIPELIARLKKASRNPHAFVVLGGPALLELADQAIALGADGISVNAAEAVNLAGVLLKNR